MPHVPQCTHRHTHTLFKIIPWCHHSYFTNNGPHVCSALHGCVKRWDWAACPVKKVHCKFLFISSSCNLRPRCAGDRRNSQINSLFSISFPYVYSTSISINHHLSSKQIIFLLNGQVLDYAGWGSGYCPGRTGNSVLHLMLLNIQHLTRNKATC